MKHEKRSRKGGETIPAMSSSTLLLDPYVITRGESRGAEEEKGVGRGVEARRKGFVRR